MNTGQTILAILAFVLLMTILVSFYGILGENHEDVSASTTRMIATTIASSYIEFAQSLAFDQVTLDSDTARNNVGLLTDPNTLGMDTVTTSINGFDDFDDFNGFTEEKTVGADSSHYRASFRVYYVDYQNLETPSAVRTFMKRMDIKVWRTDHIRPDEPPDTTRFFTTASYYHFN